MRRVRAVLFTDDEMAELCRNYEREFSFYTTGEGIRFAFIEPKQASGWKRFPFMARAIIQGDWLPSFKRWDDAALFWDSEQKQVVFMEDPKFPQIFSQKIPTYFGAR